MLPLVDSASPRVPAFSFAFLETLNIPLAPTLKAYRWGGEAYKGANKKLRR